MAEVTYADLKFMTLEQPRNQEPNEAKVKDVRGSIYLSIPFLFFISESPTPSPYWRLAAVILGIFCLGLLVTAGVLSVKFLSGYGGDMIQSFAYVSIQDFIIRSAQSYSSYSFWIALSRKYADGSWLWEDGTAFSTDLFRIPEASSSLYQICVSIQGANVHAAECGSYKFCICEKVANPVGTA
ncbi:uncharacterized protein LOC102944797 [Chelonia mydas]|uniref:uncharacterized protein LOC102944797 n=1 Tax=Chelonia mydas TaxID=8469 RepID=UPI001CA96146|nr:uncharacterized protein LOC102944797 [Chelonia mydas]